MPRGKSPSVKEETMHIIPVNRQVLDLWIEGAILVQHRFEEKMRLEMLAKQMGKAFPKRLKKDPEKLFYGSMYPLPGYEGRYGIPSAAFRKAMIGASRWINGVFKVDVGGTVFVRGTEHPNFVTIHGSAPTMREDIVRLSGFPPKPDIRYRGMFENWFAQVMVEYDGSTFTPEQVVNLLNRAGFSVGVLEGRPEKYGEWGQFSVVTDLKRIEELKKRAAAEMKAAPRAAVVMPIEERFDLFREEQGIANVPEEDAEDALEPVEANA